MFRGKEMCSKVNVQCTQVDHRHLQGINGLSASISFLCSIMPGRTLQMLYETTWIGTSWVHPFIENRTFHMSSKSWGSMVSQWQLIPQHWVANLTASWHLEYKQSLLRWCAVSSGENVQQVWLKVSKFLVWISHKLFSYLSQIIKCPLIIKGNMA